MAITADDLALARGWIGQKETDEVFIERYNRLGTLDAAIEESLTARLTKMILDRDAAITVEDIQISSAANITALQKLLEKFQAMGGTDPNDGVSSGARTTKLARRRYR